MINNLVLLTQNDIIIIGSLAKVFGVIMDTIYNIFSKMGIESMGVSIIVFTLIVRALMLPLAFKQQKSMKEMQKIQPDLKKLQDKYKNKKDKESQQKYQMEMSKLYQEHSVSPLGGCLPVLVQFPIIMSLFQVLRNIPAYIGSVNKIYSNIAAGVVGIEGAKEYFTELASSGATAVKGFDINQSNKVIDVLGKLSSAQWTEFSEKFVAVSNIITPNYEKITDIYMFLGINLADNPDLMSIGVLLPILNLVVQFMMSRETMKTSSGSAEQAQTQKTMMYMMPLVSAFFVVQMPAGLGLYWLTSSLFAWGQQVVIARHLHLGENKNKK